VSGGTFPPSTVARARIGLRAPHIDQVLASRPAVAWFEAHAENHMTDQPDHVTPAFDALWRLRHDYAVSLHGVGLSLGTAGGLDPGHLARFTDLVRRIDPILVSEHLAWCGTPGVFLNDLLPLPCTEESLRIVARHVDAVQTAIGRRLLVENPSAYIAFVDQGMAEADFLAELVARTGCGLLCDLNNAHVSAHNLGGDARAWLRRLPADAIGEIHLAGFVREDEDGDSLLIDTHSSAVDEAVWELYAEAVRLFGACPTLIEWDADIPTLEVLQAEASRADVVATAVRREMDGDDAV
jgi:uncharacterized protein (UPF0276 family)